MFNLRWIAGLVLLTYCCPLSAAAPSTQADFTPDPASIVREGLGYRYPQAGWIVVHIEGAPYERGYQHGKLLAAEIVDYAKALAIDISAKGPADAWRERRMLVNALFLRRYDREYLEEMKGIADGAAAAGAKLFDHAVDLLDIVCLNAEIEVEFLQAGIEATPTGLEGTRFPEPPAARPQRVPDDHCSAFAATGPATTDGQIVFGHITMFKLYHVRHFNIWLDLKPAAGHRMIFQTYPGGIMSGLDYYMNDAGLLVCETTIKQTGFNVAGATVGSRIRRVLQYADSIDKSVEILLDSNNGLYTNEWLLADTKTNEIAMFELGTHHSKLWRSSKREWPGGTEGFYWGCNNAKDLKVRQESTPGLNDKPANLVFHPSNRDVAWLKLFDKRHGKINADFGFEAFTLPPLASFPSCDAKFTTTKLAKELKSWAIFGPPLGRTWDATPEERRRTPDIQPLVANDWALIQVQPPAKPRDNAVLAVDLTPFPKEKKEDKPTVHAHRPPAWRGTLLPTTDADIWLAAAFADYEKIVALEKSLLHETESGKLSAEDRDDLDLALFAYRSKWLAAVARMGRDVPLEATTQDWKSQDWYDIAAGKGVLLLAGLRKNLGAATFDKAMDDFGKAHAGQEVTTAEFREHMERAADRSLAPQMDPWLRSSGVDGPRGNFWSIYSFEAEPERTLIVYGTLGDRDAQREIATQLQRKLARRGPNFYLPIKSDSEATDSELKNHHLLLIGRPATNRVTARVADGLAVKFGSGSFTVREKTYAHADSGVIVAGANALNPRFSAVAFAGLGARATWNSVEAMPGRDGAPTEVLLLPVGRRSQMFCVP